MNIIVYLSAAIAVSSLLVSMYRCIPAKVGLSLGLRSQHCIMSMYTSGGHAPGAGRRWPSRIINRNISDPFKPEGGHRLLFNSNIVYKETFRFGCITIVKMFKNFRLFLNGYLVCFSEGARKFLWCIYLYMRSKTISEASTFSYRAETWMLITTFAYILTPSYLISIVWLLCPFPL